VSDRSTYRGTYRGKGVVAACALTKVMSDDLTRALRIEIGPPAYDPHHNVLYLPGIPTDDVPPDALTVLRAYLAHEAAERGLSTWDPVDPRWVDKPGLKSLVNCLNDARIDRLQGAKYPGAGQNIQFALRQDIAALLTANATTPVEPSVHMVAVLCRYIGEGLMRYDECVQHFPQFVPHVAKVESFLRQLDTSTEPRCIEQAEAIYAALTMPDESAPHTSTPEADDGAGYGAGKHNGAASDRTSRAGSHETPDATRSECPATRPTGGDDDEASDEHESASGVDRSTSAHAERHPHAEEDEGDVHEGQDAGDVEDAALEHAEERGGDRRGAPSGHQGEHTSVEPGAVPTGPPPVPAVPAVPALADEGPDDRDVSQQMLETAVAAMFGTSVADSTARRLSSYEDDYRSRMPKTFTFDPTFDKVLATVQEFDAHARGRGPNGVKVAKRDIRPVAQVLETRLRQILTAPSRQLVRQQDVGEVDERRIALLAIGQERVMMRRRRLEGLNVAVTLSWDQSGSMRGEPIQLVAQLAHTFNMALGRLGLLYELLGWTTGHGHDPKTTLPVYRQDDVCHSVYKAFHERGNDPSVLARLAYVRSDGSTPTGDGLMFAAQRLSRVDANRKLLFVLTDGQPEMHVYGTEQPHHAYIAKTLRQCAAADIEVIGFGIRADISRHFPTNVQINSLQELRRTVLTTLMHRLQDARKALGRVAA